MAVIVVKPNKVTPFFLNELYPIIKGKGRVYWGPPPLHLSYFETSNGVKRTLQELRRLYKQVYVCLPPYKEVIKL